MISYTKEVCIVWVESVECQGVDQVKRCWYHASLQTLWPPDLHSDPAHCAFRAKSLQFMRTPSVSVAFFSMWWWTCFTILRSLWRISFLASKHSKIATHSLQWFPSCVQKLIYKWRNLKFLRYKHWFDREKLLSPVIGSLTFLAVGSCVLGFLVFCQVLPLLHTKYG